MKINTLKNHYPNIHSALLHIAYDNGMVSRLEPENSLKGVATNYIDYLPDLEIQAKTIGDELYIFCVGEEMEKATIRIKHKADLLDQFLNEWFEEQDIQRAKETE
jgi:hypothetical protein